MDRGANPGARSTRCGLIQGMHRYGLKHGLSASAKKKAARISGLFYSLAEREAGTISPDHSPRCQKVALWRGFLRMVNPHLSTRFLYDPAHKHGLEHGLK